MNYAITRTRKRAGGRGSNGQAIVEGVFGLWLIVTAGVLLVLLLFNVGMLFLYQDKVNRVANEVARHMNGGRYWLGMERPDFNDRYDTLKTEAKSLGDAMLNVLGLPAGAYRFDETQVPIGENHAFVTTVQLKVNGLLLPGGGIFPSCISIVATGVAADSATEAYGTCTLHFHDPTNPNQPLLRNIRIPMYFCGVEGHTTNYVVPKGTFVGNPVHAYIGISGADLYRGDPDHPKISRDDGTTILPYWGTGANQEYDPGR